MTQLFRDERETLERLITADQRMVGYAEKIRRTLDQIGGESVLGVAQPLRALTAGLRAAIQDRRDLLA